MLIPSIDLMSGKIVQLVQGEKKALEFDDFEYWIGRFSKYPLVQLIDLDAARGEGFRTAFVCRPDEWGPAGPARSDTEPGLRPCGRRVRRTRRCSACVKSCVLIRWTCRYGRAPLAGNRRNCWINCKVLTRYSQ